MASQTSLRGIFTYATNFLSQFSGSFDISNPFTLLDLINSPAAVDVVPYRPLSGAPSCPINGPMSCHNSTPAGNSCCFVHPGGRMLLTQFWDQELHHGGAEEDWTLHGLWPDHCDGSYDAYCSLTPRFTNITDILKHHDQSDLLDFMARYWIANRGSNAHLWAHEYNKHASCVNTLNASCYGAAYRSGVEVVDYFTRAAQLFRLLDTYRALEEGNIVPHKTRRYPLVDVQETLERFSGGRVVLRCGGARRDVLHEVWYVYFVRGSLQSGDFVPAQESGREKGAGNCVPWVRYLPKVKAEKKGRRKS